MSEALEVVDIVKRFGGLTAIDQASLTVPVGGHLISLIGPNGAGKTTMFNCIFGYLTPDSGVVRFAGEDLRGQPPHERAARGLGRTFQRLATFDTMTVRENVQVAVETKTPGRILRGLFSLRHTTDPDVAARTDEILEFMRLSEVAEEPTGLLPTGLRRLVEIGRALAIDPRIILLDEPASGLDASETEFLETVLLDVVGSGVSLLLVEHDVDLVMRIAEYIYVLDFGSPIAEGTPKEIASNAAVRAAYLGEDTEHHEDREII